MNTTDSPTVIPIHRKQRNEAETYLANIARHLPHPAEDFDIEAALDEIDARTAATYDIGGLTEDLLAEIVYAHQTDHEWLRKVCADDISAYLQEVGTPDLEDVLLDVAVTSVGITTEWSYDTTDMPGYAFDSIIDESHSSLPASIFLDRDPLPEPLPVPESPFTGLAIVSGGQR